MMVMWHSHTARKKKKKGLSDKNNNGFLLCFFTRHWRWPPSLVVVVIMRALSVFTLLLFKFYSASLLIVSIHRSEFLYLYTLLPRISERRLIIYNTILHSRD